MHRLSAVDNLANDPSKSVQEGKNIHTHQESQPWQRNSLNSHCVVYIYRYTADENGYRAEVVTNELGTESKNPADVTIQSSAPTGAEAALAGPSAGPQVVRPGPRRQG